MIKQLKPLRPSWVHDVKPPKKNSGGYKPRRTLSGDMIGADSTARKYGLDLDSELQELEPFSVHEDA